LAAAFSRAAGYCTEKSEGHRAGLEAQRGVASLGFCLWKLGRGERCRRIWRGDIHTGPAAQVADCDAGSGEGNGGTCVRPFPSSPLVGWISEKCCGRGTSTLARQRKSRTAMPAAGGTTGERVYARLLPALLCGKSLSNVSGERPRQRKWMTAGAGGGEGHGGTILRPPPRGWIEAF